MYTESGHFPKAKDESALGVTLLNERRGDFKAFVKNMNLKRNRYTGLKELESRFLKIDGSDANISHVSGFDVEDRRQVVLQYCHISLGPATMFIEAERSAKLDHELFENMCNATRFKQEKPPGARHFGATIWHGVMIMALVALVDLSSLL